MKQDLSSDVLLVMNEIQKQEEYNNPLTMWEHSPFQWIRIHKSRSIGKIGETFVKNFCRRCCIPVENPTNKSYDCCINGRKVEIKFSTLWSDNKYVFEQIRDQDYHMIFFVGVSPFEVHWWVVKKEIAWKYSRPQHTGKFGTETRWLHIYPHSPPQWLQENDCGNGTVDDAIRIIKSWT